MRAVLLISVLGLGWVDPCPVLCALGGGHATAGNEAAVVHPCHAAAPGEVPGEPDPADSTQCCVDHELPAFDVAPAPGVERPDAVLASSPVVAYRIADSTPRSASHAGWHPPDRARRPHATRNLPLRL